MISDGLNFQIDVIIMPQGNYSFLKDKAQSASFQQWISRGGKVVALEGAVEQLSKQEWSIIKPVEDEDKKKDTSKRDSYDLLKTYSLRERDAVTEFIPGAIYKVDIDNTHPLMFGYPDYYYTLKLDPAVYKFVKEEGWNTGYLKKNNYVSGFVGYKLKRELKDGLLFGVQDLGRGTVIYITDDIIFRNFWQTGKLMLANAVFLVGD